MKKKRQKLEFLTPFSKGEVIRFSARYYGVPEQKARDEVEKAKIILRDRWIESNYTDYSIYSAHEYNWDMVDLFLNRTKASVQWAVKQLRGERVASCLDFYNGNGMSTVLLAVLLPDAEIYYYNDQKNQVDFMEKFASHVGVEEGRIRPIPDHGVADAVFLFEVMEHTQTPEQMYREQIDKRVGRFLIFSSLWSEIWGGHFPTYHDIPSRTYPKVFREYLKGIGYDQGESGWNGRPTIFYKGGMVEKRDYGDFRNRIVGHGEEKPDNLLANPKNWRIHPRQQQDALAGTLSEVGWVQSVIVNKRTGHLVDGHLRVMLAMRKEVPSIPVSYVDLTEEEENLILATFDPVASLAEVDSEKLNLLLQETDSESADVRGLIEEVALNAGLYRDLTKSKGNTNEDDEILLDQQVQLKPQQEYVVINCETPQEWESIKEILGLKQVRRGGYKKGSPFDDIGTERVISARRFFETVVQMNSDLLENIDRAKKAEVAS